MKKIITLIGLFACVYTQAQSYYSIPDEKYFFPDPQKIQIENIIKKYNNERLSLKNKAIGLAEKKYRESQIDKKIKAELKPEMGPTQYNKWIKEENERHLQNNITQIKNKFPFFTDQEAAAYSKLNNSYYIEKYHVMNNEDNKNLIKLNIYNLRKEFENEVKNLLSESKFVQWQKSYQSIDEINRKLTYGLSDRQITKYNDALNEFNLEKNRLNRYIKPDKDSLLKVNEDKLRISVKSFMTKEQYDLWEKKRELKLKRDSKLNK